MARLRTAAALGALAALAAAPAEAGTATLRRALQNVALAPLDLALAPVVAGHSIVEGIRREEDSRAVRVGFALPGFVWNTGVQVLASTVREIAGLLELGPGLVVWALDRETAPLFGPAEHGPALVDVETRAAHLRIGVDYTSPL